MENDWNWENLAKCGYEEWRAHMIRIFHGSIDVPKWDGLPMANRLSWVEASKKIIDTYGKAVLT